MRCSIAVYPDGKSENQLEKWEEYICLSSHYGFREVFSTLHLPEYPVTDQIKTLTALAGLVRQYNMELTVDIGGKQMDEILNDTAASNEVKAAGVGFIRLDYGFSQAQIKAMYRAWGLRGFVINASLLPEEDAMALIDNLYQIDEKIEIRACHNYYPRPETGLDPEFTRTQTKLFRDMEIPVYACVPSKTNPRMPLFAGLPTVEEHRTMGLEQSVLELIHLYGNSGIMAADEFFSEEEFQCINRAIRREPLQIRVQAEAGITKEERAIIFSGSHHIRYDSNQYALRSQSSREMSQYAMRIVPRRPYTRAAGAVTVDNERYGRYSGELQFVLFELPADERVNIAGHILDADLWKLQYYRYGYDYICIES